jgi:hypothetical protein
VWCWATRAGLAVTGQPYTVTRPAAARLAHLRAVLAVRLSLEAGPAYRDGRAWWRCERRIRAAIGGRATGHVSDAEVSWPDLPASPYPGECWAIEAELTPKPLDAFTRAPAFLQDPTLLDALPVLAGILTDAPQRLQAQLFAALDLQLVYKKDTHQVTIYATLTPATPDALTAIIATSEPPTSALGPSTQHDRLWWLWQPPQTE